MSGHVTVFDAGSGCWQERMWIIVPAEFPGRKEVSTDEVIVPEAGREAKGIASQCWRNQMIKGSEVWFDLL